MIHWLTHTFVPNAEHSVIFTASGAITGAFIVAPFKKLIYRARHHISAALDSLDPDVPVGLTRQLDELIAEQRATAEMVEHIHTHLRK